MVLNHAAFGVVVTGNFAPLSFYGKYYSLDMAGLEILDEPFGTQFGLLVVLLEVLNVLQSLLVSIHHASLQFETKN